MSFIFKLDELEPAIKRYAAAGGEMNAIRPDLRELERLIRKQDYDEASRVIDQLLERMSTWQKGRVA